MTFTYDPELAAPKDWVRLLIGDTDRDDEQLQDEELAALLVVTPVPEQAAVRACRMLAARYARRVTKSVGELRIQASDLYEHYKELADELTAAAVSGITGSGTLPKPVATGVRRSEKRSVEADTDRDAPAFRLGMEDPYPSAPYPPGSGPPP